MNVFKYGALALAMVISQNSSAVSIWGRVKNAVNDCEYTDQQRHTEVVYEKSQTKKLKENYSGHFSESDFYQKPWMRLFQYVIVVNKGSEGPNAQTLRMYEYGYKIHEAKVSTGREGFELKRKRPVCAGAPPKSYWSQTPTGFYTPKFLEKKHTSSSWDSDMPFAIFFDVENGLALHEAHPHYVDRLGSRASGGCVRQDAVSAEFVFDKVLATEGMMVPEINVDGTPALDEQGNIKQSNIQRVVFAKTGQVLKFNTYSALIIVEE